MGGSPNWWAAVQLEWWDMRWLRSRAAPSQMSPGSGKVSVHGDGIGNAMQRAILEDEGVVFDADDRVDFARFGWSGPDEAY